MARCQARVLIQHRFCCVHFCIHIVCPFPWTREWKTKLTLVKDTVTFLSGEGFNAPAQVRRFTESLPVNHSWYASLPNLWGYMTSAMRVFKGWGTPCVFHQGGKSGVDTLRQPEFFSLRTLGIAWQIRYLAGRYTHTLRRFGRWAKEKEGVKLGILPH